MKAFLMILFYTLQLFKIFFYTFGLWEQVKKLLNQMKCPDIYTQISVSLIGREWSLLHSRDNMGRRVEDYAYASAALDGEALTSGQFLFIYAKRLNTLFRKQ